MGSRTERQLLDDAEDLGYVGLRAPASGARPGSDAGDLWIGRAVDPGEVDLRTAAVQKFGFTLTELYIIEEKYKSNDRNRYIQHGGDRLDEMIDLAKELGATPVLAVRWSTQTEWSPGATHFLRDAREVRRTDVGNVSVKPETAEEEYQRTENFF